MEVGEVEVEEEEEIDHHHHHHSDHHHLELGMVLHQWVVLVPVLDLVDMDHLHLWVVVVDLHLQDGLIWGCYHLELIYLGVERLWIRLQRR